ncbi:MAG: hypothetical protein HYZ37_01205 [Candidatus Solibacter usitatus]|nr:hypothetical protein [Candidatus Solibacter usitatus]
MRKLFFVAAFTAMVALTTLYAQRRTNEEPSWAPKPDALPKYLPPHKPHTNPLCTAAHKRRAIVGSETGRVAEVPSPS